MIKTWKPSAQYEQNERLYEVTLVNKYTGGESKEMLVASFENGQDEIEQWAEESHPDCALFCHMHGSYNHTTRRLG